MLWWHLACEKGPATTYWMNYWRENREKEAEAVWDFTGVQWLRTLCFQSRRGRFILVRGLRSPYRPCSGGKNKNAVSIQGKVGSAGLPGLWNLCSQAALSFSSLFSMYMPGTGTRGSEDEVPFFFFFFSGWKTGGLGSAASLIIEVLARHVSLLSLSFLYL